MAQVVKNLPARWENWVRSLGQEDSLEKGMATHSSILAWRVPRTEEPGGLQSIGCKESDTTEWLTFIIKTLQEQGHVSILFTDASQCQEQHLTHRMLAINIYCMNEVKQKKNYVLFIYMIEKFFYRSIYFNNLKWNILLTLAISFSWYLAEYVVLVWEVLTFTLDFPDSKGPFCRKLGCFPMTISVYNLGQEPPLKSLVLAWSLKMVGIGHLQISWIVCLLVCLFLPTTFQNAFQEANCLLILKFHTHSSLFLSY